MSNPGVGTDPVIVVGGIHKAFRVPTRDGARIRERIRHPWRRPERDLQVLRGIDFSVERGEFFGVVGQNGSGKSTLLKLLAGVYRADAGRIQVAGRLAPFLELGAGFNPALTAYDNVVINGLAMGLTLRQVRDRYEQVIDFAGLAEFQELELRNYSSGMKVRLAFAVLTQVDADVMLLDEVLAVGDVEFQIKCEAELQRLRNLGTTIVLVTHSIQTVNAYCDRALLLHGGVINTIGEPIEVTNRLLELHLSENYRHAGEHREFATRVVNTLNDPPALLSGLWLGRPDGSRCARFAPGEPIVAHLEVEVKRDIPSLGVEVRVDTSRGYVLFAGGDDELQLPDGGARAGGRLKIRTVLDNPFSPGKYVVFSRLLQPGPSGPGEPATLVDATAFEISGEPGPGVLQIGHKVDFEIDEP